MSAIAAWRPGVLAFGIRNSTCGGGYLVTRFPKYERRITAEYAEAAETKKLCDPCVLCGERIRHRTDSESDSDSDTGLDTCAASLASVSVGGRHTCGVAKDGDVVCWGDNRQGQASPPGGAFAVVSAGERHTCGLRPDGTALCWGFDGNGELLVPAGAFSRLRSRGRIAQRSRVQPRATRSAPAMASR